MTRNAISWHPADVRAAIAKRGTSLSRIARENGLDPKTVWTALKGPSHAAEQAIARALGIPAHHIWPGRYDSEGITLQPRIRKQLNAENGVLNSQNGVAA